MYRRPGDRLTLPHRRLRERTAFVLQRVAANMRKQVEMELAEAGTGVGWAGFTLLAVLGYLREAPQASVSSRACLDRTSAAQVFADLEADGFVERRQRPDDRRHILVAITPSGRATLEAATAAVERGERAALKGLRAREQARVHALLDRVVPEDVAKVSLFGGW